MCWVGWEECICGKGNSLSNRIRTSYTSLQLLELEEKEFINNRYLSMVKVHHMCDRMTTVFF